MMVGQHVAFTSVMAILDDMMPENDVDIVSVTPDCLHLTALWTDSETRFLRIDSVMYPELWIEIDTYTLTETPTRVRGRFSDALFAGGLDETPVASWSDMDEKEITIRSSSGDCVVIVALR